MPLHFGRRSTGIYNIFVLSVHRKCSVVSPSSVLVVYYRASSIVSNRLVLGFVVSRLYYCNYVSTLFVSIICTAESYVELFCFKLKFVTIYRHVHL